MDTGNLVKEMQAFNQWMGTMSNRNRRGRSKSKHEECSEATVRSGNVTENWVELNIHRSRVTPVALP